MPLKATERAPEEDSAVEVDDAGDLHSDQWMVNTRDRIVDEMWDSYRSYLSTIRTDVQEEDDDQ